MAGDPSRRNALPCNGRRLTTSRLRRAEELTVYPPRSLGEAFRRYRRTHEWAGQGSTHPRGLVASLEAHQADIWGH